MERVYVEENRKTMSLVFEKQIQGPATHAIVIGVGDYVHLPGGTGKEFEDHGGIGQLTSPPYSARAFALWLLRDYKNPSKPLASLELLISEKNAGTFKPPFADAKRVQRANLANVETAIRKWYDRGNTDVKHLMIFYFCGHGVGRGMITTLLLDDFGEWPANPLEQSIDFNQFRSGMDICKARQQCFFVDACRKASQTLITRYNNYTGKPIIPGSAFHSVHGRRCAPAFYSTALGERAYGFPKAPSVFTDALLKATRGAGSDEFEDGWRVDTDTLYRGMEEYLRNAFSGKEHLEQIITVDGLMRFTLHYLSEKPRGYMAIGCKPREANSNAHLSYSHTDGSQKVERQDIQLSDWCVDIEVGHYCFSATFPNGAYNDKTNEKYVKPPFQPVRIQVTP